MENERRADERFGTNAHFHHQINNLLARDKVQSSCTPYLSVHLICDCQSAITEHHKIQLNPLECIGVPTTRNSKQKVCYLEALEYLHHQSVTRLVRNTACP